MAITQPQKVWAGFLEGMLIVAFIVGTAAGVGALLPVNFSPEAEPVKEGEISPHYRPEWEAPAEEPVLSAPSRVAKVGKAVKRARGTHHKAAKTKGAKYSARTKG